jgi:hypothetical protein
MSLRVRQRGGWRGQSVRYGVEANIGRVAVALAGEVVGSTEFVFLGHTLRLSLAPPTRQQGGRTGAAGDQSSHDTGASSPFSSLGSSSTSSKETVEIIGEYIDAYMDSRPKVRVDRADPS